MPIILGSRSNSQALPHHSIFKMTFCLWTSALGQESSGHHLLANLCRCATYLLCPLSFMLRSHFCNSHCCRKTHQAPALGGSLSTHLPLSSTGQGCATGVCIIENKTTNHGTGTHYFLDEPTAPPSAKEQEGGKRMINLQIHITCGN